MKQETTDEMIKSRSEQWQKDAKDFPGKYDGRWTHFENDDTCGCDGCRWVG